MNLITLQNKFNTHIKCIRHLEEVRWNGSPSCPHCQSESVTPRELRKKSNRGRKRKHPEVPRKTPMYHCNGCNKDFTVLMGTIFESSKMPLQKWFMLIAIMLNARKGISSMQVSRDLGITYKSAWYSAMRVRCAMLDQASMLEGIVEMDEAFIGGKPRYRYKKGDNVANLSTISIVKSKRGRGSDKIPIVGIVEREGKKRIVTQIKEQLTSKVLLAMLKKHVKMDSAIVVTDEAAAYKAFDKEIQHLVIKHAEKQYVKGIIHTNTIEGYWSIIKNGLRGQYHVLSKKYLPFYLAEFSYKYNRRSDADKATAFDETIGNALTDEKCAVNYKPKAYPKFLAYRNKKKKVCTKQK